jgi:hypothetical protein
MQVAGLSVRRDGPAGHVFYGLFCCALVLVSGCGGIKPSRKPEATFDSLKQAVLGKRYEALWNLLSAKSREKEVVTFSQERRRIESEIDNLTPEQKQDFLMRCGVSPEEFMNMGHAEVFAMNIRNTPRLTTGLEGALRQAEVTGVRIDGDAAVLTISVGGEEEVELTLQREQGLYRLKSFDDLLDVFRPGERTRRPGKTPRESFDALIHCIRDGAYEDLWELVSPEVKEQLAVPTEKLKEQYRGLPASARRPLEHDLGVTIDEFLEMSRKEAFVVQMRYKLEARGGARAILSREYVSEEIEGDRAAAVLTQPDGEVRMPMVLVGGRWLLEGF